MAEDNFKNIMISGVVILLFTFMIVWFAISLGTSYDKSITELESAGIDLDQINNTLQTAESNANTWKGLFTGQSSWTNTGVIIIEGILGIFESMWNFVVTPINLILDIMENVLQIPSIVTSIILTILTLTIIFSLWRLVKQGD